MGVQMLVSDYLDQVIKSRPYKYSTKQSLIRDIKRLGIADLDTSEVTSALIRDKVDCIPNHNSRRRLYITARSIFKDLGVCQDLPKMEGISRIYDLPEMEDLHELIDQSKYRLQLFLCMYAGLRVGEACAVTPSKLEGDYLNVNVAYSQDGLHLGSPKTYGKVLYRQIAGALARRIVNYAKEGQMVTQGTDAGFIKFGSRLDLYLPLDADIKVNIGDITKAGRTVIAELKS